MSTEHLPVWPVERLESALSMLSGAQVVHDRFEAFANRVPEPREVADILQDAAIRAGHEVSPVVVRGHELEDALQKGPQLVVVWMGVVVLESATARTACLLDPRGKRVRVPLERVANAVRDLWARKLGIRTRAVAAHVCHSATAAKRLEQQLREVQLAAKNLEVGWRAGRDMSAPLGELVRAQGHPSKLLRLVGVFAGLQLFVVLSWVILANAALSGWNDAGSMLGWCLCIATIIVLRLVASWREGLLSIELGALLKRRLMAQASRSDSRQGIGEAMGRVLEAEVLEEFSLGGGLLSLMAVVELAVAFALLSQVHWLPVAAFVVLLFVLAAVCVRFYRRTEAWTKARLRISQWLIGRLVGFKTVALHGDEQTESVLVDRLLVDYLEKSKQKDSWASWSLVILSRAPLALGFLSLLPLFFAPDAPVMLWTGIGGVLLASSGVIRLAVGLGSLCEGAVAAKRVLPYQATRSSVSQPRSSALSPALASVPLGTAFMHAHGLDFRYPDNGRNVLQDVDLEIRAGDRILLQGPSGSGKSTLASLLSGTSEPSAGLLLMRGLDRGSFGPERWRRKVLAVSQFHQNHILQGSLAFNLLMGRGWPAPPEDLALAETVCVELGLGPLLERMPDGLEQTVGTTGWQLSHGERARVYLARALLQSPDLIILDESFASLDHETIFDVMACVDRRAATVLVNAHP